MAAIGVVLAWGAYWLGLSGVSLVKGYNNSPLALANPVRVAEFNTSCYTGSGVFPTGRSQDNGPCGGGGGLPTSAEMKKIIKSTGGVVQGGHGR